MEVTTMFKCNGKKSRGIIILTVLLIGVALFSSCSGKNEEEKIPPWSQLHTLDDYYQFLKKNPESKFATEVRARIEAIEKEAWVEASVRNTLTSYLEFLEQCPKSKFVSEAKARIQAILELLRKERHPALKDARKARIVIYESYGEAKKVSYSSKVISFAKSILEPAGVIVEENTSEYDFTIIVTINGTPLSAYYDYRGSTLLYTGALVKGTITFETRDGQRFSKTFTAQRKPPDVTFYSTAPPLTPDEAPFWVFEETYFRKMAELMYETLGAPSLFEALVKLYTLKDHAKMGKPIIEMLAKKKDAGAIEPLIRTLFKVEVENVQMEIINFHRDMSNESSENRKPILDALTKIDPQWRNSSAAEKLTFEFLSLLNSRNIRYYMDDLHDHFHYYRRVAAVRMLGELQKPQAIESLLAALTDVGLGWNLGIEAAKALDKINPKWRGAEETKRKISELITRLESRNIEEGSVWALGEIGDPRAVEPLIAALKDEEFQFKARAAEALKKITGKDFGQKPEEWQKWWEKNKGRFIKGK
jgi:hypothetical protein